MTAKYNIIESIYQASPAFINNFMDVSVDVDQQIRATLRQCGQWIQKLAAEPFEVTQKAPGDYVTSVDQWLDEQLSVAFAALFPEDGAITEENASSKEAFHAGHPRLWCIDPLDGTEEFIQGKQYYAMMVGLLMADEPVAGWVYAPAFDQMYCGGKDWGLFHTSGDRELQPLIPVNPPANSPAAHNIVIGDKDQKNFGSAISKLIPGTHFYSLGSFGLKVLEVIQGRAGLYLYFNGRVKLWDTTGPIALAKAAGLICCDLDGEPIRWTGDAIDPQTLAHKQPFIIGWPEYVNTHRDTLRVAVEAQRRKVI